MYHLFGAQVSLDNIVALCGDYLQAGSCISEKNLKQAYHKWLQSIQSDYKHLGDAELVTTNSYIECSLANYFASEHRVDNVILYANDPTYPNPVDRKNSLNKALDDIRDYDDILYSLINFVMHTILCTSDDKTGGTSVNPSYIGMMCAHYDMHAEQAAVPELIVHEFSHNLLFIDEHRYGHYASYQLLEHDNLKIESYYQDQIIKLPLDRVLHRMVIFVEILYLRDRMIGHAPKINQHLSSSDLIEIIQWYIDQIESNAAIKQLMLARGYYIYSQIKTFIRYAS